MPASDVGTAFGNAGLDPPGEPDGDEGGYVGNGEGVSGDVFSISQPVVDPRQEPATCPWSTSKGIRGPVGKQNEMGEAEPGSRWEAGWDKLKGHPEPGCRITLSRKTQVCYRLRWLGGIIWENPVDRRPNVITDHIRNLARAPDVHSAARDQDIILREDANGGPKEVSIHEKRYATHARLPPPPGNHNDHER